MGSGAVLELAAGSASTSFFVVSENVASSRPSAVLCTVCCEGVGDNGDALHEFEEVLLHRVARRSPSWRAIVFGVS